MAFWICITALCLAQNIGQNPNLSLINSLSPQFFAHNEGGTLTDSNANHDHDYHDRLEPTPQGYLRWQRFPVRVSIQAADPLAQDAAAQRDRQWVAAMGQALQDWQRYFPLVEVPPTEAQTLKSQTLNPEGDQWDILILRSTPPLQRLKDGTILPSRLADTRYEFLPNAYSQGDRPLDPHPDAKPAPEEPEIHTLPKTAPPFRMIIRIGTQQGTPGLIATARHELGHALGLWGHSDNPVDVMYAAQIGTYPPISDRDLRTLHWLYPTAILKTSFIHP